MKQLKYAILLVLLSGCGYVYVPPKIDVVVSGKVALGLNMDDMETFFIRQCKRLYPTGTNSDINQCVADQVKTFVDFLKSVSKD